MNCLKALIGDFINVDGRVAQVTAINRICDTETEYFLDDGSVIGEDDFSYEDVLMESEVCFG